MADTVLERMPLNALVDGLCDSAELAEAAQKSLGYSGLQQYRDSHLPLQQAMAELNLAPFEPDAVAAYQQRERQRMIKRHRSMAERVDTACYWVFFGSLGTLVTSMVVAGITAWLSTVPLWVGITMGLSTCTMLIAYAVALVGPGGRGTLRRVDVAWVAVPIKRYPHPVPEFVLQTAVDLKAKCPSARFFVEELRVQQLPLDPFLFVKDPAGHCYYLEVWNEPRFDAKRVV